jgi:hypothetical protein
LYVIFAILLLILLPFLIFYFLIATVCFIVALPALLIFGLLYLLHGKVKDNKKYFIAYIVLLIVLFPILLICVILVLPLLIVLLIGYCFMYLSSEKNTHPYVKNEYINENKITNEIV